MAYPVGISRKSRTEELSLSSMGVEVAVVVVEPYYNGDEQGPKRNGKDRRTQLPALLSCMETRVEDTALSFV